MDHFSNVQVSYDDIPSSTGLSYIPLDSRYMVILLINSLLVLILIVGVLTYLWTVINKSWYQDNFQWGLLVILLLFIIEFAITFKAFSYRGYAFRQKDISYKQGWLWRNLTTVPFNRVQHCEVSQGVLDRYFGLAKLKIFTAGGSSSDLTIPGLTLDNASDLKDYILEKIKEDE